MEASRSPSRVEIVVRKRWLSDVVKVERFCYDPISSTRGDDVLPIVRNACRRVDEPVLETCNLASGIVVEHGRDVLRSES